MLTPKLRYIENDEQAAGDHSSRMKSNAFQDAAEAAFLEMIANMTSTTDTVVAASNWQKIDGARLYLEQLLTVGQPFKLPSRPTIDSTNLNHSII